jgi:hypothetical protein
VDIREAQIEDILVGAPALAKTVLNLKDSPSLLCRQMIIPSGRLDLLYAYGTKLLLVELKVTPFHRSYLRQVLDYKADLLRLQDEKRLVQAEIQPYLLCVEAEDAQRVMAAERGVICNLYDPEYVLRFFYDNFSPIAFWSRIKPVDLGIWNLHLIHRFIYFLEETTSVRKLRQLVTGSVKSLYNKIRFSAELRLVEWSPNSDFICLTQLGKSYLELKDLSLPERLSEGQAELLRSFVIQNPFESCVILGIASVVESAFALARNSYPVPLSQLLQYFTLSAGKHFDWKTDKARYSGTRMYSNYAVDLGLLARSGDSVYLTPEGMRFTVQMQMHKSIKMTSALRLA